MTHRDLKNRTRGSTPEDLKNGSHEAAGAAKSDTCDKKERRIGTSRRMDAILSEIDAVLARCGRKKD